jgi:hypothetical protein
MSKLDSPLVVGINYVNKKTISIIKIDYSEVIKVKSATIKTSISVLTGNGYNVSKRNIITDVSKLNYVISASGMYGEYCGTDSKQNLVFKLLQNTTIIDKQNNNGIVVPINTKITLSNTSSNKYIFIKNDALINNNNNSEFQRTINKLVNNTYNSVSNIGNPQGVIQNAGSNRTNIKNRNMRNHIKTRSKTTFKKKINKTRKNKIR